MERKILLLRQKAEEPEGSRIFRAVHREPLANGTALLSVSASAVAQTLYSHASGLRSNTFTLRLGYRLFHFGQQVEDKKEMMCTNNLVWESRSVSLIDPISFGDQKITLSLRGVGPVLKGMPNRLDKDVTAYERAKKRAKTSDVPLPAARDIFLPRELVLAFDTIK